MYVPQPLLICIPLFFMVESPSRPHFNAFSGVFVPTFLSIIGVILFLRLGFIIGVSGVAGSIAIIVLSISVTLSTGLALSSITTNIRIGEGGAYSIIAKTLGLEVGGSVGIPLFLAQSLSVALYVFGFAEAWAYLFPDHPTVLIALAAFGILFALTFTSTKTAVRAQMAVIVVVSISLVSVFLGGDWSQTPRSVPLVGTFQEMPFWGVFALFFPAVTGLMAGTGLSGELKDPKRQIPLGVLTALAVTTSIYLGMVIWFSHVTTPETLITDTLIMVKLSSFPPIVLAGILSATFSSALTTLVAAPRVLLALSENEIIPKSHLFAKKTQGGEPKNAILLTSALVAVLLVVGNLDAVAQILTMFFLITYAMINVSVFAEQSLGLPSFRPTFTIPRAVPLYGAASSIIIMFLINSAAGMIALGFIFATYIYLVQRDLEPQEGDVRSGLFRALSEWAAKKVINLPESTQHVWKPNILIPVITTRTLFGNFPLIESISLSNGTMTVLGFNLIEDLNNPEKVITRKECEKELTQLPLLIDKFGKTGIFTSYSTVCADSYLKGLLVAIEAVQSQVFPPNVLFLPFKPDKLSTTSLKEIVETVQRNQVGLAVFDRHPEIGLGSEKDIHVWISPKILGKEFYHDRDFDLALLIAYRLQRNWDGIINLWMCVEQRDELQANRYLDRLTYEARFPDSTAKKVVVADFMETLKEAPQGDIHIMPFKESDVETILKITDVEEKSFLFVLDSGKEDIFA